MSSSHLFDSSLVPTLYDPSSPYVLLRKKLRARMRCNTVALYLWYISCLWYSLKTVSTPGSSASSLLLPVFVLGFVTVPVPLTCCIYAVLVTLAWPLLLVHGHLCSMYTSVMVPLQISKIIAGFTWLHIYLLLRQKGGITTRKLWFRLLFIESPPLPLAFHTGLYQPCLR